LFVVLEAQTSTVHTGSQVIIEPSDTINDTGEEGQDKLEKDLSEGAEIELITKKTLYA